MSYIFHLDEKLSEESAILASLERLAEVFRINLWENNQSRGLSSLQLRILIYLDMNKKEINTVSHLTKEFTLTKSTISSSISTLEKKGYIKKIKDLDDMRISKIVLSDKGIQTVGEITSLSNKIKDILLTIDKNEKSTLLKTLLDLISKLQQKDVIPMEGMCFSCGFCVQFGEKNKSPFCKLLEKPLK